MGREGPDWEYIYSSFRSLTSAVDRMDGQRHAPAALTPGIGPGTHCLGLVYPIPLCIQNADWTIDSQTQLAFIEYTAYN
jgi:hypothetical protein